MCVSSTGGGSGDLAFTNLQCVQRVQKVLERPKGSTWSLKTYFIDRCVSVGGLPLGRPRSSECQQGAHSNLPTASSGRSGTKRNTTGKHQGELDF